MDYFYIKDGEKIVLPEKTENSVVTELLSKYTFGINWNISYGDEFTVTVGDAPAVDYGDNDFSINVTKSGACIKGKDYNTAIRGYLTFLEMIFCYGKNDYRVECGIVKEKPLVDFRSVHICIFPEFSFEHIRRAIRTCAIAKYTHIFLEPWGMLKLDALKELSWQNGFSKEQVKELVKEAKLLGIQIVPFFQHLGHAALARLGYTGKHTVLDQNPSFEHLYYPKSYGWVWNFKSKEVRELLKSIREELIDLYDECDYFHLGCDESGLEFDPKELADYLNEVKEHLKSKGKRAIIWGDMMLSHDFFPDEKYECNSSADYANKLLDYLDKDIIIADWQYDTKATSWSTSKLLKEKGFDVICCPWNETDNLKASIETVVNDGHFGVMKTTWNNLFADKGIPGIIYYGLYLSNDKSFENSKEHINKNLERAHSIFRKVAQNNDIYEMAGWVKNQV